jgi:REP element-mobilizing transposase RayT
MNLQELEIYHIYNRGNNKERLFFCRGHYEYFLERMEQDLLPYADILAWCLMPNHFHFLIYANEITVLNKIDGGFDRQLFSDGLKHLLSNHAKKINYEMHFTGNRFQQKTKAKNVTTPISYAWTAFQYIHQNPLRSGLVKSLEGWEFSSFREYLGIAKRYFCNQRLAIELLDIDMIRFYDQAYEAIDEDLRVQIFKS